MLILLILSKENKQSWRDTFSYRDEERDPLTDCFFRPTESERENNFHARVTKEKERAGSAGNANGLGTAEDLPWGEWA